MPQPLRTLEVLRINRIMQGLQDVRLVPQDLTFLRRTPLIAAMDHEIMASYDGTVQIADLVADDQEAVTYNAGQWRFETNKVPNLKHGTTLTQEDLNLLLRLMNGAGMPEESDYWDNWENRTVDNLLLGVRQRQEALLVAMAIDGFSYDRLGIKMSNVTWGMPADLKVTPTTPWTDAANATPIADIESVRLTARVRYGQLYNRVTLSTPALQAMIATAEFKSRVTLILAPAMTVGALPFENLESMATLVGRLLGMTVETYDARYWSQSEGGTRTSAPYLALNKVILDNSADDNSPAAKDFANGVVTETVVSALAPTNIIGQFAGPTRGPVSFATANPTLNPPTITYWGVARGFPRKHRKQVNAVLTVGTITDTIPVGVP